MIKLKSFHKREICYVTIIIILHWINSSINNATAVTYITLHDTVDV